MAKPVSEKEQRARNRQRKAQHTRWYNTFNFLVKYLKRRGISVEEPCCQGTNVLVEKAIPVAGHHILVVRGCGKCFHATEIFDRFKRTNEILATCKTRCRELVNQSTAPRFLVPYIGPFIKEHQIFPGICPYPMLPKTHLFDQNPVPHGHGPVNPRLEERRIEGQRPPMEQPMVLNTPFTINTATIDWDATVRTVTGRQNDRP